MDSVYETLLNRLLEEVKNEDIKKGINIALSAYTSLISFLQKSAKKIIFGIVLRR